MKKCIENCSENIGSICGNINYPPMPLVGLKLLEINSHISPCLVCNGDIKDCDLKRLVLKKFMLTGYAAKANKTKAIVRHMFYDALDVHRFKLFEVYFKYGQQGHIQESVGTTGSMKVLFKDFLDHKIVHVRIHKKVLPRSR
jgi:hypothetical protein